jgi:hypothetical protein
MNARYQDTVFDEWAIISLVDYRGQLLAYIGPRKQGFQRDFLKDAGSLRPRLLAARHDVGDFEFAHDGVGTGFESFTVLGKGVYLIFNNTVRSMDGIVRNPRWLGAQEPFIELSDMVREDPLVLPERDC